MGAANKGKSETLIIGGAIRGNCCMLMVVVAVVVVMVLAFPRVQGFGKNVRQFIPRQVFFFFFKRRLARAH